MMGRQGEGEKGRQILLPVTLSPKSPCHRRFEGMGEAMMGRQGDGERGRWGDRFCLSVTTLGFFGMP